MKKVNKQITKAQTEITKSQKMIKDIKFGQEHQNVLKEALVFTTAKNLNDYLIFNDDNLTKSLERAERLLERLVQDDSQQYTDSDKEEDDVDKVSVKFSEVNYSVKPKKGKDLNKSYNSINAMGLGENRPTKSRGELNAPIKKKPSALSPVPSSKNGRNSENELVEGKFNYPGSPIEAKGDSPFEGKGTRLEKERNKTQGANSQGAANSDFSQELEDGDLSPKVLITPSEALRRYATKLD